MSVHRRRLINYRASMPNIDNSEKIDFKSFLRNNLNSENLESVVIFCVNQKIKSKQVHIRFEQGNDLFYKNGRITYFESYLKTGDETFDLSHVGRLYDIISQVVKQILFKIVPIKTEDTYLIGICEEQGNYQVDLDKNYIFKIDKTENGENNNNTCPICIVDYENKEKLTLKCKHTICSECFWSSIDNNILTCPLCRKSFFSQN